jgi:DNA repair protein RecN (Recombination protein N)
MIKSLTIKNYALIEELDMRPSSDLNMITGETGAGKSIMLGALGLLLGNRADTKVLWDADKKCMVEIVFDLEDYKLEDLFRKFELDYEHESIFRREISPSGKSRAFINDTPVTLDVLRKIGSHLVDIHSQHESLQLGKNLYQLQVLDAFAQNQSQLNNYKEAYHHYIKAKDNYNQLLAKSQNLTKEEDYKRFILKELEEAKLHDVDQNKLENELNILENAEEVKIKLSEADQLIESGEYASSLQLKEALNALKTLLRISGDYESLHNRLESLLIELKDIHSEVLDRNDRIIFDPEKAEELKQQLDLLYRLQKKHQVDSVNELILLEENILAELQTIDNLDEELDALQKEMTHLKEKMMHAGSALAASRKSAAENFAKEIQQVINQIGIENGKVSIDIKSTEANASGLDEVDILFSANKGIAPQPIKQVASGGEFSRLIFAIKYLIADKTALPTVIFDEIDTGVSGEIALKMVGMMQNMAKNHQVISISHLPQFAAGGDSHYYVFKDHSLNKSVTRIRKLENEERVEAIARMIGGDRPTDIAIESARELLKLPA